MLDIRVELTKTPKAKPADESKLGFGKEFSDHMFVMDYDPDNGWHDARIIPYQPFQMDPATVVFHYAQEIFEGLKAYRTAEGKIQLFRPDCNAQRSNDSADRMCMPNIPVEDFVQAVKALVKVDQDWVPHTDGTSLYIRPFMIATDVGLGVHASKHYRFCIITSPSGAYYAEGLAPVRIYVEDEYIRAAPGLTGFCKCGGQGWTIGARCPSLFTRIWRIFLSTIQMPKIACGWPVPKHLRAIRRCSMSRTATSFSGKRPPVCPRGSVPNTIIVVSASRWFRVRDA